MLLWVLLFSCSEKSNKELFTSYLINDSDAEMWDHIYYDSLINKVNRISYLFYKNGRCEYYTISVRNGERIARYSDIPKWNLVNDSIMEMICKEKYQIISYGGDSIVLKDMSPVINPIIILYRVKDEWNINEESIKRRDSVEKANINKESPCVVY